MLHNHNHHRAIRYRCLSSSSCPTNPKTGQPPPSSTFHLPPSSWHLFLTPPSFTSTQPLPIPFSSSSSSSYPVNGYRGTEHGAFRLLHPPPYPQSYSYSSSLSSMNPHITFNHQCGSYKSEEFNSRLMRFIKERGAAFSF